jgi:hypothetical protein
MAETLEKVDVTYGSVRIQSYADLQQLSGTELLNLHNRHAPKDKQCQRFSDKPSGMRRTWAMLVGQSGEDFEAPPEELEKQAVRKEVQEAKKPPLELDEPPAPPKPSKPKKEAKAEGTTESRGRPRGFSFRFPLSNSGAKPPKESSKRFKVLQLLLRKQGATFDEVMEESGWKRTDAYEGIRLLHYANGYRLWTTEKGDQTYIHASAEKQ